MSDNAIRTEDGFAPFFVELYMVPRRRIPIEFRGELVSVGRTANGDYYEIKGRLARLLDPMIGALYMAMLRPSLITKLGVTETKL